MSEPFFLVGPTAVGKTDLAVDLAERIGAEIVSADAFQVYAGLDLLTAKPTLDQRRRVRHHLIGSVPLSETYSVARYLQEARDCLADIAARGKKALIVGGSGLYVKALTHGLARLPAAQPELRRELERLYSEELLARLAPLDPATATAIDPHNKRRLIRALEVCLVTGQPFSSFRAEWPTSSHPISGGLFLFRDRSELVERIEHRTVALLMEEALQEVEQVEPSALSATSARILGLAEVRALLAGKMAAADCHAAIATQTRQYAKRQVTWFKRETYFSPLNLSTIPQTDKPLRTLEEAVRLRAPGFWQ